MITIRDLKQEDISIILEPVQEMFIEHDLKEPELFTQNSFTKEAVKYP